MNGSGQISNKGGYSIYLLLTVIAAGLSFVKFFIVARLVSPEDFGTYSLVMTSYVFLIYAGSLGANEYMLKVGSMAFGLGEHHSVGKVKVNALFYGFILTLLLSLLATTIMYAFASNYYFSIIWMSAAIAIPSVCYNITDSYYRSTNKHIVFSSMMLAKAFLVLCLILILVKKQGVQGVILAESLGALIIFLIAFLFTKEKLSLTHLSKPAIQLKQLIEHGWSTMMVYMTRNLSMLFDRYFISLVVGLVALGKYSFSLILYQIAVLAGGMLTNIVGPKWIANYAKNPNSKQLLKEIIKFSIVTLGAGTLLFPVFSYVMPYLLKEFFPQYSSQEVEHMLLVMYPTAIVYLCSSFSDWFFIALSKEKIILHISIISFVSVIIMFLIISNLGLGIFYYALSFFAARLISWILSLLSAYNLSASRH